MCVCLVMQMNCINLVTWFSVVIHNSACVAESYYSLLSIFVVTLASFKAVIGLVSLCLLHIISVLNTTHNCKAAIGYVSEACYRGINRTSRKLTDNRADSFVVKCQMSEICIDTNTTLVHPVLVLDLRNFYKPMSSSLCTCCP